MPVSLELEKWVKTALSELSNEKRLPFTVISKESNQVVGSTSIGNLSKRDQRVEIGWTWLSKAVQGTGLNIEVKKALLSYCFDECMMERVECKTDVLNIPASKSLEKVGMVREGILRSHTLMTHRRRRDTVYYSLLRHEWQHLRN